MPKLSKETKQRLQQVFQYGQFAIRWGLIPTILYLGLMASLQKFNKCTSCSRKIPPEDRHIPSVSVAWAYSTLPLFWERPAFVRSVQRSNIDRTGRGLEPGKPGSSPQIALAVSDEGP
ncbi:TOM7 protein, partial [Polyodon spathula]|nr:TOM7 protein [Polyodon spathula]